MAKHSVSRARCDNNEIIENIYIYRGTEFRRDERVPTGYCGRYRVGRTRNGRDFTTRSEVKAYIDRIVDAAQATDQ